MLRAYVIGGFTKAIVTVLGADTKGIIAKVSGALFECGVNILDISQTVFREEIFSMVMLTDMSEMTVDFSALKERLDEVAQDLGMDIQIQREEIFNSMHRV